MADGLHALMCIKRGLNTSGVDDRLGRFISAENDEKVADHGSLLFFVQVDNTLVLEFVKGHLQPAGGGA